VVLFFRVMVTWDTVGSVEPEARMKPPWGTLVVFTEIWMDGPGGRVVMVVVGIVVAIVVVIFAVGVGVAVSFPVGGGPVVGTVVTTVVSVTTGVVSTDVTGWVVAGAGVVTAGGRVRMTMVGVWDVVLSFRM
jgi:hypothetical protein